MQTTQTHFFKKSLRAKHFYDEYMANAMLWNTSFTTNYNISVTDFWFMKVFSWWTL